MNTLRVEELENRTLLSGAYLAPTTHAPMPNSFGAGSSRIAEPVLAGNMDIDRIANGFYLEPNWNGQGVADFSPVRGMMPTFNDPGEMQEVETIVVVEIVITDQPPVRDGSAPTGGAGDTGGTVNTSPIAAKYPTAETGATPPSATGDTSTSHSAAIASVTAATRVNSPTPFVIVPSTNVSALAGDAQVIVGSQVPARATITTGGIVGASGANQSILTPASTGAVVATPVATDANSIAVKQEQPPPIGPGVLATLSAADLSALGRGLEQFLGRIERAGQELVVEGDGLRPWLVASAAAATACEIARRQLKRAAELAAEDISEFQPEPVVVV
jgi:hypothetical protein